MHLKTIYRIITLSCLCLVFYSCTDKPKDITEVIDGSGVDGATAGQSLDNSLNNGQFANFKPQTIYFGYDDHTLSSMSQSKLSDIASFLSSNSGSKIEIQGHCDERGTDDYNLALGLRRADSVYNYLKGLQIDGSRIVTRSFGEEKPANMGRNENSWSKNRRAEFIILAN